MSEQNFKNHTRLVPMYHGVAFLLIVAGLVGSVINLLNHHDASNHYSAALLVVVFLVLLILFWYARVFALRAQDRAIRAEENFRHFVLTGKPLDKNLRMGQVIALRFASDDEFVALAKRAVQENLSQKQIKEAINNWKPDYNRA
jgi:cbb3-type cytochrome oxidase subunit 3